MIFQFILVSPLLFSECSQNLLCRNFINNVNLVFKCGIFIKWLSYTVIIYGSDSGPNNSCLKSWFLLFCLSIMCGHFDSAGRQSSILPSWRHRESSTTSINYHCINLELQTFSASRTMRNNFLLNSDC